MEEVRLLVGIDVDDDVVVALIAVDDVHVEEGLTLDLLLHLLSCLPVHQMDLHLCKEVSVFRQCFVLFS